MTHQQSTIRIPHSAIVIFVFALAVFLRILPGERMIDDAYITFRYARNIVNGQGFVYNPGERVLGTTTPFYTLLMASLSLLLRTQNFPRLALWVNALADGITCALLVPLGETLSGRRRVGVAAGLLYSVAAFSVTFAVGGMETSVVALLIVLTALLYLRGNTIAVENRAYAHTPPPPYTSLWPLTASLTLLTRPDALIFVGPIALDFGARWLLALRSPAPPPPRSVAPTLPRPLTPILLFITPLALWLLFATLHFGSPVPQSVAAKIVAYKLPPTQAFVRLWQHYSTPFFEQATFEKIPFGNYWPLPGLVIYFSLYLIGALNFARRDLRTLAVTIYPPLYFAVFAIANPLIFRWYLTPPMAIYFVGILGGVAQIGSQRSEVRGQKLEVRSQDSDIRLPTSHLYFAAVCALFLLFSLRAWTLTPNHGPQRPAPEMAWFKLEELYTQVGQELAPEVSPQTVIAVGDIGAMGYFSGARILDTLGLISLQSSGYYPLPPDQLVVNYAISADLIADQKPDYVVFLEVYGRRTLLVDSRFLADYTLQQKIPTDIYGSDGLLVYQRNR